MKLLVTVIVLVVVPAAACKDPPARQKVPIDPERVRVVWTVDGCTYVDGRLEEVFPRRFGWCGEMSDGLAAVRLDDAGKLGYIARDGTMAVPAIYDDARPFRGGLARVQPERSGPYGFIDRTGAVVIPIELDLATSFQDGIAFVRRAGSDRTEVIDRTGKTLRVTPAGPLYTDGMSCYLDQARDVAGCVDGEGNTPIPEGKYSWIQRFDEGLAPALDAVRKPGDFEYGYVDKTGALVIPFQFPGAERFSEGLAAVKMKGHHNSWSYIDRTGTLLFEDTQYVRAHDFSEGLAAVCTRGPRGSGTLQRAYIDRTGRQVIAPFDDRDCADFARPFEGGLAVTREGLIDAAGTLVWKSPASTRVNHGERADRLPAWE